jgi:lipopolysaccharide heptosyltransferase I
MRRKGRIPLRDYPAQRIALIKPSALGDIIHGLPVLTALRQRFPRAHITWIVNRAYEPLLRGHPDLDATMPFDRAAARKGWAPALGEYRRFWKECRQQQFDLVIDLQGLLRSGLMAVASGAQRRVGLSTAREGATWFYTDVVKVADFNAVHAVDRCWLIAAELGVGAEPKQFRLPAFAAERAWALGLLQGKPRPWIALGAGSRWITKRWPPEHFAALLRRIEQRLGGTVVCVGSREEVELGQAATAGLAMPVIDLAGKTSLPELAGMLGTCDLMLANDTGPLHLATALGRPVVAPYTCTKILLNGPYGGERGAVESRIWCQGSYLKRCPRLECMTELTPERLWPALDEVLATWEQSCRSA